MTSLIIHKLDPATEERLRSRATLHKRSMEEEARLLLDQALAAPVEPANAYERIRRHFAAIGGVELEIPPRGPGREPPTFE